MKIVTLDNKTFEAESLEGLAVELWKNKFNPEPTIEEWMAGSAKRAKEWSGIEVSTSSVAEHIQDLISMGILTTG